MPKVSVIIPVYNGGDYVSTSSSSVLNQTLYDLELILVDDGSDPETAHLCDVIAESDDRVVVVHKANGGISSARNQGIMIARGEYIAFLDQDDSILPEMYDTLYSKAADGYDVVISDFNLVYADRIEYYQTFEVHDKYTDTYKDMLQHGFGGNIWNMIIRREIVIENGISFPEHLRHGEDTYFSWRLFLCTEKVSKVNHAFYQYNLNNPNQVSNHLDERFNECCRANIDEFIAYLRLNGKYHFYKDEIDGLILQTKTDLVIDSKYFHIFNEWHKETNSKIIGCRCLGYKMKIQMLLVSFKMYYLADLTSRLYFRQRVKQSAY